MDSAKHPEQSQASSTPHIRVTRDEGVLDITLHRPEKLNALTLEMIRELDGILDTALVDGTRVVTITGEGRAFCAGADLSQFNNDSQAAASFIVETQKLYLKLSDLPFPVIAVVNGTTIAGGLELVLAADFSIASASAQIGDGHTNFGVIPGAGGAALLPKRVPLAIAKYLVFTGLTLSAEEMKEYGLFAEVTSPAELQGRAREIATRLAKKSPVALRLIKQIMRDTLEIDDTEKALELELRANSEYAESDDMAEGLRAFRDKRSPVYASTHSNG